MLFLAGSLYNSDYYQPLLIINEEFHRPRDNRFVFAGSQLFPAAGNMDPHSDSIIPNNLRVSHHVNNGFCISLNIYCPKHDFWWMPELQIPFGVHLKQRFHQVFLLPV